MRIYQICRYLYYHTGVSALRWSAKTSSNNHKINICTCPQQYGSIALRLINQSIKTNVNLNLILLLDYYNDSRCQNTVPMPMPSIYRCTYCYWDWRHNPHAVEKQISHIWMPAKRKDIYMLVICHKLRSLQVAMVLIKHSVLQDSITSIAVFVQLTDSTYEFAKCCLVLFALQVPFEVIN